MLRVLKIPASGAWVFLAATLAGVLALEFYFSVGSPGYPLVQPITMPNIGGQITTSVNAQSDADWGAALLGRPILAPSRHPVPPPTIRVDLPRLSAIMITPAEQIAVLTPVEGNVIVVGKNSRFGPFKVLSIAVNDVTIKGPAGVFVLRADFNHRGPIIASTPNTTVLPGGIDVSAIQAPLPSAATWAGPPMVN